MGWVYRLGWLGGRFILFCTMRVAIIRPEAMIRRGACLVASTHVSHLDPFLLGVLFDRPIDWMARIEFYKYKPAAWVLKRLHAFPVNRFGVPVSAIRTSLARLNEGRIVGLCPEGGVAQGKLSCLRGGTIKRGVCLLAYRTGTPVLPCVMLGTDQLNRVGPWLPFRRARLWLAFGERCIEPRKDLDRRAARQLMAEQLQTEYRKLFAELIQTCGLSEGVLP